VKNNTFGNIIHKLCKTIVASIKSKTYVVKEMGLGGDKEEERWERRPGMTCDSCK
jgi:hypothetical protein